MKVCLTSLAIRLAMHSIELGTEMMELASDVTAKKPRSDAGKRRGIRRKTRWRRKPSNERRKRRRWTRTPAGKKYKRRRERIERKPSTKRYRKRQRSRGVHRKYPWMKKR